MKKALVYTLFLMQCLIVSGQNKHFYTSEKLSSNLITSICQDRSGYMWIGTEYGLNKYDGYRFTSYFHRQGDVSTLVSNNITTLFVDSEGQLWVGTGIGLSRYHAAIDAFEQITLGDVPRARVNDIIKEDEGHLLIGTAGYGLFRIGLHDKKAVEVKGYAEGDDFYSHIHLDGKGQFWKAGSGPVISCRQTNGRGFTTVESPFGAVTGFVDTEGGVLMVCLHGLVFYRDGEIFPDFIDISVLGGGNVLLRTAYQDREGNIFVGTMGKGLCWIPRGTHKLQPYYHKSVSFDLNTANVWALAEDNQDNLWVGCLNRGLLLLPQREPQFSTWSFSGQNVSIGGSVTSVCQGDNGIVWCAVQNNGIYGFDENGQVVAHPQSPSDTYSIYRDKGGQYWIGTANGLYTYQPLSGTSKKVVDFASNYINVLTDDGAGNLYFSTYSKGFCSYSQSTREVRNFTMHQEDSIRGRLHNNWIMSMMLDSQKKLWIGTSSNLCCYDSERDTFKPYGWEVLLEGKSVFCIYETRDHRILMGTDEGLYLYNSKEGDARPFPNAEVLADKVICGIEEDRFGDIWISTSKGIWRYQQDQKRFINYLNGNGLVTKDYVRGLAMSTTLGTIFFGISDGLTSFRPEALRANSPHQGAVHLTGLLIGGRAVNSQSLSDGQPIMADTLADCHRFTLSYIDNTFTMEFSLMNFLNAENVIYEYRLNGATEWSRTAAGTNSIPFHHLPPGSYTIEVRAYDSGVYTEAETYRIIIRAPWYRTSLAYLIYILLLMFIVGLLIWLSRRRAHQQLDEEKMKFLINATHDIRSPLTLVMSPLHKLLRRDLPGDVRDELKTIEHNASRIQNLVNQILDIRKIDKQQMKLQCQKTDIVQYVGNILKSYTYMARERGITLTYRPQVDKLDVWVDRSGLDKVVDNLLSNAFKYTYDGGEINVDIDRSDDHTAQLQVIDNGMGIKGDVQKIFDRFYQGSNSRSVHIEGTGIGLNLCKMIVTMHHGTIEAANRTDTQGSIFTVHLPLGNGHLTGDELLSEAPKEKVSRQKPQSSYHVLVVDDDAEIGSYITQELGGYYHISSVTSAREALHLLLDTTDEQHYDLVVSDVMMPEMDGFTFLRMVKTNMNISHIPVVMLTSKADVANRLEGLEKGADAYLAKPFDMDELHMVISNLINKNLRLRGKFSGAQQQKEKVVEKKVKGNDEQLMERIMKVVNDHLSDSDLNVEMLTSEVGISRAQLHRKMKEMTGLPISEFIRNIRLEQAVRLLKEQKINVTQVAYSVGFSNLAHFSTVFRKQFGVSPSEYIERNQKGDTKQQVNET